jgi:hypothetical protein
MILSGANRDGVFGTHTGYSAPDEPEELAIGPTTNRFAGWGPLFWISATDNLRIRRYVRHHENKMFVGKQSSELLSSRYCQCLHDRNIWQQILGQTVACL